MRLAYVWSSPKITLSAPIGYVTRIRNTIRSLEMLGHEVDLVTAASSDASKFYHKQLKTRLPSSLLFKLKDAYNILHDRRCCKLYRDSFRKRRPDLIYERFVDFHQSASKVAVQLGIPYLVEMHDPSEALDRYESGHSSNVAVRTQERVAGRANAVVVVSRALRDFLVLKGLPSERIHVIPNAVDERLFDPNSVRSEVRKRYHLAGKVVVGYVGSMMETHGINLLLKAAERITADVDNVHFLLVGPDKDGRLLQLLKSNERSRRYFTLTGTVEHEHVPEYISAMDICVMPDSNWNGSPVKIFEYGAMAKPVVAPRYPPIEEVLVNLRTGLLTEIGDVQSLAENILSLIHSVSLRQKLGLGLMDAVLTNHTWNKNAERILAAYATSFVGRRDAMQDGPGAP